MFGKRFSKNSAVLSVFLVFAESFLSLLLRFDKPLRERLKPLVKKDIILCVRTYLPHYVFYVSFNQKGVLLDTKLPEDIEKEDVLMTGSLLSFSKLLLTGEDKIINKMQFKGEKADVNLIKDCSQNMGLQQVIQDVFKNIDNINPEQQLKAKQTLVAFETEVEQQQQTIAQLNKQLISSQQQTQKLQKQIQYMLLIATVIILSVFAVYVIYFVE